LPLTGGDLTAPLPYPEKHLSDVQQMSRAG